MKLSKIVWLMVMFHGCVVQALDQEGDGFDDIWTLTFNAKGLSPAADPDGDGFSTAQEHLAGTDPLSPLSRPASPGIVVLEDKVLLSWPTVSGKEYRLERRLGLTSMPWEVHSRWIASAAQVSVQVSATGTSAFFRLVTGDVDSDGDGLSDYDEHTLGLDPLSAHSGRQDSDDLKRIRSSWSQTPSLSLGLLDPRLSERWPDPGLVAVRRDGSPVPLTVNIALEGSATQGTDYSASASVTVNFPWGVREVWVTFHPLADTDSNEGAETIEMRLLAGAGYKIAGTNRVMLTLADDSADGRPDAKESARFLIQAAWGPDQDLPSDEDDIPENVAEVMRLGFEGWLDDQFSRPVNRIQPWVDWASIHGQGLGLYGNWKENSWWNRVMGVSRIRPDATGTTLPDPLRQRMAFALSQILVVSDRPEALAVEQAGMANYYDLMVRHAFGNYEDLLLDVATHPAMGIYLSHLGNRKADPATRVFPDENFARELMQLFTIGLWELNADGTRRLDAAGQPIPTYGNRDITELARVFTGLSFGNNEAFTLYPRDFTLPMRMWDAEHDCGSKTLLGGRLSLPARTPSPGHTGTAGMADVRESVTALFRHPNTGPFVCRQLIQRFVTSNPGTGYVGRVASVFADNGAGVRGDLKAVLRALLMDDDARSPDRLRQPEWGKLREPLIRVVNMARAFNAASTSGWYPLDQFTLDHMQDPMNAPSVFNFFLPNHSPSGPLSDMGWVAPEFQLLNASSAITGPNYFWNSIVNDLHRWGVGNPDYAVRLDLRQELAMVVPSAQTGLDVPPGPGLDPDPLLRRLDLALTGGTLEPRQFQIIREAVLRIPSSTWLWHRERLRLAIYLIVTSAEFNVLQ